MIALRGGGREAISVGKGEIGRRELKENVMGDTKCTKLSKDWRLWDAKDNVNLLNTVRFLQRNQ